MIKLSELVEDADFKNLLSDLDNKEEESLKKKELLLKQEADKAFKLKLEKERRKEEERIAEQKRMEADFLLYQEEMKKKSFIYIFINNEKCDFKNVKLTFNSKKINNAELYIFDKTYDANSCFEINKISIRNKRLYINNFEMSCKFSLKINNEISNLVIMSSDKIDFIIDHYKDFLNGDNLFSDIYLWE